MKDIEKYFRVYAEVNLDAIIKNIEMMREKIKPETGIVGVIKTDGYGHGAVPIAKALENECVGYAVATLGKDTILEDTALISRCTYWELFLKTCAV